MGTRRLRPLIWADPLLITLRAGGVRPLCGGAGAVEKAGATACALEGGGRSGEADVNAWRIATFANYGTAASQFLSAPRTVLDRRYAPRRAKASFDLRVRRVDGDVTPVDAPVLLLLCDCWIKLQTPTSTVVGFGYSAGCSRGALQAG